MDIRSEVKKMKEDSPKMAALSLETRNQALLAVAEALQQQKEKSLKPIRKTWKRQQSPACPSLYRNG